MTIHDSQQDMRSGYLGGAPGLFVSGAVWLAASGVAATVSPQHAMWTLLLGGMSIFPLSIALTKLLGRPGKHATGNPLGTLALEGTAWFVAGIAIAFVLGSLRLDLFFPTMLLLIGGRYLTFQTVYGLKLYWVCGGVLLALGFGAAVLRLPPVVAAAAGGAVEIAFGLVVLRQVRAEVAS